MPSSKLILDYFRSIDFNIWEKKINFCIDQLIKLKTDSSRSKYQMELYAVYLQLIEIFCRNVFTISEEQTKHLFTESCAAITKRAEEWFKNPKFLDYLLDNYVFGVNNKDSIKNFDDKRKSYKSVITEAIDDYTKHFQFLNAYKHGFRVYGTGSKSLYFQRENSEEKILIKKFNSHTCCFFPEKKQLRKMEIFFNWENVAKKSLFVLSGLINIQKVYLAQGTHVKLDHYFIADHEMDVRHSGRGTYIALVNDIK